MTITQALGTLVRTENVAATHALAARENLVPIAKLDDLRAGTRAIVDLEVAPLPIVVAMGERFRSRGATLVVAARPGKDIPFSILRNLAMTES